MKIKSVGYMGIGVADSTAWLSFATEVIGMMPARNIPGQSWGMPQAGSAEEAETPGVAEDGSVYLKMDERQWRIAVHPQQEKQGLLYLGLEVENEIALEQSLAELQSLGITVNIGSVQDARSRAVSGIAYLQDPAGNNLELFYGPTTDYNFSSPISGQEFVAGHLGIGHLNLFVDDLTASFDFYTRVLGFKLTDYIRAGEEGAVKFMRCNERHHSLAMVGMGKINGLQHAMFEMKTIDDVGKTLDRAMANNIPITSSLGRHRNDGMLSFYMRSPSGFDVEIGCDCLLVDDTWTVNEFCEGDVWGHQGLMQAVIDSGEFIKKQEQNGS